MTRLILALAAILVLLRLIREWVEGEQRTVHHSEYGWRDGLEPDGV